MKMAMETKTHIAELFSSNNTFKLESGEVLPRLQVAYQTYGKLNKEGTNAVVICHALTGNAHAAGVQSADEHDPNSNPDLLKSYSDMFQGKPGWWDELIGPDKLFDTNKYYVICSNFIGSCYGSTGPVSIDPITNKRYASKFPFVSVRDMVKVQKKLIDYLGVKKVKTVTGGSLGGFQVFEWALLYPEIVETIIPIATATRHSPWAIGLNQTTRDAIKNDGGWQDGFYEVPPTKGLSLARKIAMITYRSYDSFWSKFGRDRIENGNEKFQIESYLDYQGTKLNQRFDANTYISITEAMDHHDITRNRGNIHEVLESIKQPSLCIGISSDVLYPPAEQKEFARQLCNSEYKEINSIHGHDAFLIEFDQLNNLIKPFIKKYF
jgi:homoserine O-acetyltransferase